MAAKKLIDDSFQYEPLGDSFEVFPSEEENLVFLINKQGEFIVAVRSSIKSKLGISKFLDFEADEIYINNLYKAIFLLIEEKHEIISEYCVDIISHEEIAPLMKLVDEKYNEITKILFICKSENYNLGLLFNAFLDLSGYLKSLEKLLMKIIN